MDYGDSYWGLYRDYYRDPFSHSVLSTGERKESKYSTGDSQPSVFRAFRVPACFFWHRNESKELDMHL